MRNHEQRALEKKKLAQKKSCLSKEVETSMKLLKKGMGDLQKISFSNDFYHAPILLLSSGFERLIKCLLCLAFMDELGEFEKRPYKKSKGHEFDYLLGRLLSVCAEKNYSSADIDFLKNDKDLIEIISCLSDFAQGGRYYNLDIVVEGESCHKDPDEAWEEIEKMVLKLPTREDTLKKLNEDDLDDLGEYKEINLRLIMILERFARALARLFALADFGDFTKQVSPLVRC